VAFREQAPAAAPVRTVPVSVSVSTNAAALRRRRLQSAGTAAAVVTLTALTSACAAAGGAVAAPAPATSTLPPVPPAPAPSVSQEQVDRALSSLDGLVTDAMDRTGVPGVAVAVVYRDQVVYSKGFGVREVGRPEPVDPDTVFQLASVSKPLASTVVAGVVGQGVVEWDQPVGRYDPSFALSDPYVTEHATIADLLSHRSGLHTGAGDLLEDLGFDREYILSHLDQQPLDPFPVQLQLQQLRVHGRRGGRGRRRGDVVGGPGRPGALRPAGDDRDQLPPRGLRGRGRQGRSPRAGR
jgi:CubicO group peptidase (beta-lactamase class C family)